MKINRRRRYYSSASSRKEECEVQKPQIIDAFTQARIINQTDVIGGCLKQIARQPLVDLRKGRF